MGNRTGRCARLQPPAAYRNGSGHRPNACSINVKWRSQARDKQYLALIAGGQHWGQRCQFDLIIRIIREQGYRDASAETG